MVIWNLLDNCGDLKTLLLQLSPCFPVLIKECPEGGWLDAYDESHYCVKVFGNARRSPRISQHLCQSLGGNMLEYTSVKEMRAIADYLVKNNHVNGWFYNLGARASKTTNNFVIIVCFKSYFRTQPTHEVVDHQERGRVWKLLKW